MATFKVSETDSSRVMFDKLNTYMVELKKEKYNNVLKLLNELFGQSNKSLRNFTKIDCEYFESKSLSKTIKILDSYKEKLGYNIDKLKEFNKDKKSGTTKIDETKKDTSKAKGVVDITDEASKTKIIKSKTKSGSKIESDKEEFTPSKEIFALILKLIKSLDYKLVKSVIGGKSYYSFVMCT